ncbi:interference hedgehog [Trichonephila clavipes]|nr:interference hedgehog [Trichonephila clavipes]
MKTPSNTKSTNPHYLHPQFLNEPTSRLVKVSEGKAVFRCEASPPGTEIRWLMNGHPVTQNKWIRVAGKKLTVLLVKFENASKVTSHFNDHNDPYFQCEIRFRGKVLVSAPAKLILATLKKFPPSFDTFQITAIVGNTVVIPCDPPYSVPTVITEFVFRDSIITRSTERKHLMLSGDLQIFDVKQEDSGIYTCVANNPFLAERVISDQRIILRVKEPSDPKPVEIIKSPRSKVSVALGRNITLECAAVGHPAPVITWRKRQGKLPQDRYLQFGGNLHLISVMQADEGTYECEADNNLGTKEVRSTDLEIQETPKILKQLKNVNLETGSNLTLNCPVRGYPKPILKWLHNGKEIISDAKKSFLIVSNIGPKHGGVYQCFATNSLGTSYDSAVVTVTSGNSTVGYDDEFDYDDYDLNGTPLPNNDKEFTTHDQNVDGENNRKDTSPSDQKPYGKKGRKKKLSKGVKLIPPSKPEITRLSNSSVMVRWSAGHGGLRINFFKVQYKEVGKRKSDWMTIDEDIATHIHSYAVTNLRTGGAYRFRIAAVYSNNDNKAGPISDKFVLYKDPPIEKPSIGPIITSAEAVSPSAITLYWEYDDIDTITVEGFFIHYRATHTAGKYLKVTVLGANTRSHIISHLLPDTGYDIKMQCFNIAGTSEFSNIFTSKTKVAENYVANRNRNGKPHYDDDINTSFTESVSSKNSMSNGQLYLIIGIAVACLLLIVLVTACYFLFCKRQNEHQGEENGSDRENQLKIANGHVSSNGYVPVNSKININVNPMTHLNIDSAEKLEELQEIVSNNNEIIRLQTFNTNRPPQEEPLLTDVERESNLNENNKATAVISSSKPHTSADSPTEL